MTSLREPVYTQKEAEMAAGMGHYILPPPPLDMGMKQPGMGISPGNMGMSLEKRVERKGESENDINDLIQVSKQLKTMTM